MIIRPGIVHCGSAGLEAGVGLSLGEVSVSWRPEYACSSRKCWWAGGQSGLAHHGSVSGLKAGE